MRKPVTILALDEACIALAEAVQQRVAAACRLDDLVQWRRVESDDLVTPIESVHERRQSPDSPLRARDDISSRELVLLLASACGSAPVLEIAKNVRDLYRMRRFAEFYAIEILCLMPDVLAGDYGAAYSLLKQASAVDPKPFDAFWLLSATNANRVRFARIDQSLEPYADAIAGALTFEPELSGALSGAFRPRGMDATYSSFGYAELVFPRAVALQRLESRLATELVREKLLANTTSTDPRIAAKQLVIGDPFAAPMGRIGVEAGQSLFKRFRAKTFIDEKTRSADEVIAAVRAELKAHRDSTHTADLQAIAVQSEATASELTALLARTVDERLDGEGFSSSIALVESLIDPLPDLHEDAAIAPRNLATEIHTATAALDERLRFTPNVGASTAARKRVRELAELLRDQKLVADSLAPITAEKQLAEMDAERQSLLRQLPELLFAEERENNAARNAARDAEAARLAEETQTREQTLRELFAQKPRAEQALAEALEARRSWLWKQVIWAALGLAAIYSTVFRVNPVQVTKVAVTALGLFAIFSVIRYVLVILPPIRFAREALEGLLAKIETADQAKNTAHNDALQFEFDMAHRKATPRVLQRVRDAAKETLDALRARLAELESLSFDSPSITTSALVVSIIDDADVDAWYSSTADDRKPLFREFPVPRSAALRMPLDELRRRVTDHAAGGFDSFRKLTLGEAATRVASEPALAPRLKRFAEACAPMVEVRDDDPEAQRAMQRDTTLWIDESNAAFLARIRRRLLDAHVKPAPDPLRANVLTRVLHYPAYVLGQIEYYRAHYDPAKFPDAASADDLVVKTGAEKVAFEKLLIGRALAQNPDVSRGLRALLRSPLSPLEREAVGELIERYPGELS